MGIKTHRIIFNIIVDICMFLLLDKPTWFTSFDMIRKIKKLCPRKTKIGHAGTLDPLATGLMIIAIGKDTKRLKEFVWLDKEYIATIDFSKKSDTWDMDHWKYFEQLDITQDEFTIPAQWEIEDVLKNKVWVSQRPLTPFSAKKVKWKKLYEYAREWNPLFIDSDMELIDFEIIKYEFPVCKIRLHVWSGTYIRSIAHRLGEQFWLGWILTWLRRTKVGEWKL